MPLVFTSLFPQSQVLGSGSTQGQIAWSDLEEIFVPAWYNYVGTQVFANGSPLVTPSAPQQTTMYNSTSVNTIQAVDTTTYPSGYTVSYLNDGGTGARLLTTNTTTRNFKTIPATGPFTIEVWYRLASVVAPNVIFGQLTDNGQYRWRLRYQQVGAAGPDSFHFDYATTNDASGTKSTIFSSGNVITRNSWNHYAVTRDSDNTLRIFFNGNLVHTQNNMTIPETTTVQNFMVGVDVAGNGYKCYVSAFRYSKTVCAYTTNFTPPTQTSWAKGDSTGDPFWENTVLLLRGEANNAVLAHGTSTLYTSSSPYAFSTTTTSKNGTYGITTTDSIGGGVPYELRGGNTPISTGGGSATIEFWFRHNGAGGNSTYKGGIGNYRTAGDLRSLWLGLSTSGGLVYARALASSNGTNLAGNIFDLTSTSFPMTANTWYHLAVCYDSSTKVLRLFQDGVLIASATSVPQLFVSTAPIDVGYWNNINTHFQNAIYDDIRYTKAARYTSNFTPPGPMPAYSYVA